MVLRKNQIPPQYTLYTQRPIQKKSFPWILFFVAFFSTWVVYRSLIPELPLPAHPPKLYSNQCRQDLCNTFLDAISNAKSSVYLVMFGLTDKRILSALSRKIRAEIPTTVYYDKGGSPGLSKRLQGPNIHPMTHKGLMHQKILIIDQETVFLGSANMTSASLKMHDNLVIGLVNKTVAQFLANHKPYTPGYLSTKVGGQEVEIWLLPDPRGHAIHDLRKKIRSATRSVRIALFTFTHTGLIEEVIDAHNRGVQVTIVIDMHSGLGASAKAIELFKKGGVNILLSQGTQLLHHKFIYIDESELITGSANWTKAAFYKNSDCIISLHELDREQKKFMTHLWRQIATSAKTCQSNN